MAEEKMVKVLVHKAIVVGGVYIGPRREGSRVIPVEATISERIALAHGPKAVEILEKQTAPPKTKPAEPPKTK